MREPEPGEVAGREHAPETREQGGAPRQLETLALVTLVLFLFLGLLALFLYAVGF